MATSLFLWVLRGRPKWRALPLCDLGWFTLVSDLSIVSLNLSLMLNSVGLYQIAKLATIPFVCSVEWAWGVRTVTPRLAWSLGLVLLGVGLVTIDDPAVRAAPLGAAVAAASVVTSGGQQLLVRRLQQRNACGPQDMLSVTGPAQALTLLLAGPGVDRVTSGSWIFSYATSLPAAFWICASALLAVGVNATQFACLGRFSALSYQVMGHLKTVLVLLGGWLFLGDALEAKRAIGMLLAVGGMVDYARAAAGGGAAGGATASAKNATPADALSTGRRAGTSPHATQTLAKTAVGGALATEVLAADANGVATSASLAHATGAEADSIAALESGGGINNGKSHGNSSNGSLGIPALGLGGGSGSPSAFAPFAPSILLASSLVTATSTATPHAASPRAAHAHATHAAHGLSPLSRDEGASGAAAGGASGGFQAATARKSTLSSDGAAYRTRGAGAHDQGSIRATLAAAERSSPSPRAGAGGAPADWQGQAAALGEALTGAIAGAITGLGAGHVLSRKTSFQTATKDLAIEALAGWMPEKTEADKV